MNEGGEREKSVFGKNQSFLSLFTAPHTSAATLVKGLSLLQQHGLSRYGISLERMRVDQKLQRATIVRATIVALPAVNGYACAARHSISLRMLKL